MKVEDVVSIKDDAGAPEFVRVTFRARPSPDERAKWQELAMTWGGVVVKPQVLNEFLPKLTNAGEAGYFLPQDGALLLLSVLVPRELRPQITTAWLEATLEAELQNES